MKLRISALFATLLMVFGPKSAPLITYSDDDPFVFNLSEGSLKIVQFTDLHLTYGFDKHDLMTLELIKKISLAEKPDLVVFTGDQTLSLISQRLYKNLINFMEDLKVPWTFIFGNHDYDFTTKGKLLKAIKSVSTNYLYFKVGPKLDDVAAGNFVFNYYYNDEPFYNLYFLDSKDELMRKEKGALSRYEYLSTAQVNWYKEKALLDQSANVYSTVFMHIPLPQYLEVANAPYKDTIDGSFAEHVYAQGRDTFFFAAMKEAGVSQAVFVGHDHRNNFTFMYEDVLLGYGQSSGYNGYGGIRRGARVINISNISDTPVLETYVVYGDTL